MVNSSKLNRATILLGILGVLVAAVLSLQHAWQREIPCGGSNDCTAVAAHPSSYMMGYPVAFYGLFGYVALVGIGVLRSILGKVEDPKWVLPGYVMSIIGFLSSWYLQYISFTQIRASCKWCIGSAIIMTLTFIAYSRYYSQAGKGTNAEGNTHSIKLDAVIGAAGTVAAVLIAAGIVSTGTQVAMMREEVDATAAAELVPENSNALGDASAKVTLVEFADLCCPSCRKGFPKLQQLKAKFGPKIRVVYRHFPLFRIPGHEMTTFASVASEVAAEQGKFWQFASAFTSMEDVQKTPEDVYAVAESVGIMRKDVEKAVSDENSPAMLRMLRDYKAGLDVFKISGTPTYFLSYNGKTKKLNGEALVDELNNNEIKELLK